MKSSSYLLISIFLSICILTYCNVFLSPTKTQTEHCTEEKPLLVLIPSYNNSGWYDWNLSSVFKQKYNNYRVIYIDDCSIDETYELVTKKITESQMTDRVQVIRNTERKGALANLYTTCCALARDDEIIVTLDGDDALAHEEVFACINDAYQDPDVWMTYGQYQVHPQGWLGICQKIPGRVIRANDYRTYKWVSSHIRTYYAWLCKRIKEEDLKHDGLFYSADADLALMLPMLEMAGGRFKFIDRILYFNNQANPLNDFKVHRKEQKYFERIIRKLPRYEPLLPIILPKKTYKKLSNHEK